MDPTAGRRRFEDLAMGEVTQLGSVVLSRGMIVAFAREFDPFPFHLDEAAAKSSLLGGLAASGYHTAALTMRLLHDALLGDVAVLAGAGITELKWKTPFLADDAMTGTARVVGLKGSAAHPEAGVATLALDMRNRAGEPVLAMQAAFLVALRDGDARPQVQQPYDLERGGRP